MFTFRRNQTLRLMAWYFWGPSNTDDDYARYVESFTTASADGTLRPVGLLYVEPGNPLPNARWRKAIAEASASLDMGARPLVVFASPMTLVRGIVTAVNWLRPPPFDFETCGTLEAALAWLEARRPGVRAALLDLVDDCAREAGTPRPP